MLGGGFMSHDVGVEGGFLVGSDGGGQGGGEGHKQQHTQRNAHSSVV